tara:strand:- start:1563 stop:2156 length:594 start_codon:yes stop_codon:yes gene_type:complete
MEGINEELDNKSIERTEIKEVVKEQPKKTRTEAQKQAFEKARKKREANLKARKEAEELDSWAEDELQREDPQPVIKPPAKKRGRPRKTKAEPPAQQFIQPPDPQLASGFGFGQINPYQYYQPPPQPAPVNNNYYYYGAQPPSKEEPKPEREVVFEPQVQSEPSPYGSIHSDEELEEEDIDYDTYANQQATLLKYRFA